MVRKSPGYIKLQGQTRNSSEIRGVHDIRAASSMFMTREEQVSLESAMDFRGLGSEARRERDKFARQDASVKKFRESCFRARERLAATINKNRALMELRHELQRRRRIGEAPDPEEVDDIKEAKLPLSQGGFNKVELSY